MEDYKNLQSDGHTLNVEKINTCLQQTVLLTGQAIGALTFHRRRNLLNAMGSEDSKTITMLRDDYIDELKNSIKDKLFGEEFHVKLEKDAK